MKWGVTVISTGGNGNYHTKVESDLFYVEDEVLYFKNLTTDGVYTFVAAYPIRNVVGWREDK